MVNGFTFWQSSRYKTNYYCSRSYYGCKSKAKLNSEGFMISLKEDHNHPPPTYVVGDSGLYYKVSR